jgi:hypothetical protein
MVETANVLLRGTQAGEKPHEAALPNLSDGLQRKT